MTNIQSVVQKDGITGLWKGATPRFESRTNNRLGRLVFSGGIVFSIYEAVLSINF